MVMHNFIEISSVINKVIQL